MTINRSLVSVVDDDESVRESLPDLLREFGFAVEAFASAEEFLGSAYVGQTKCLILDIAMPNVSGWDIAREIRSLPGRKPMLVAISGVYVKSNDQLLTRAAGFKYFLQKPCEPSFLLNILAAVSSGD